VFFSEEPKADIQKLRLQLPMIRQAGPIAFFLERASAEYSVPQSIFCPARSGTENLTHFALGSRC
jgi:hypothetical protein